MKKSILLLAFTAIVASSFAFHGGEENKAKKGKCEKSCCKKGEKKTDSKTETKPADKK